MELKDTSWQDQLISLYLLVCQHFQKTLWTCTQRFSNNDEPVFTDQEVMTLYLFGTLKQHRRVSDIYAYACDHLRAWFPRLPSYGGFVQRLNRLGDAFAQLAQELIETFQRQQKSAREWSSTGEPIRLVDSMPIIMARGGRSDTARVACELADKGYCSSKQLYYHGVKLHVLGYQRAGALPLPEYAQVGKASEHDLTALHTILPQLSGGLLAGDKIYGDRLVQGHLAQTQDLQLVTPIRKKKGQPHLLLTEQVYSQRVSRLRQPIESLFNWIEEKTGIQAASKVRSTAGLMVHVFGKLAAAMYLLTLNS